MTQTTEPKSQSTARISLDTWAVLLALAAVALIRFGLIQKIPW